ncbi:MAG: HAD-IIA family hydrolase [Candidatus Nanopelagicales bacterium]
MTTLAESYDGFLFDLDGVVYKGTDPIDHAAAVINKLDSTQVAYITNNASRTPDKVVELLASVGVAASEDQIVTSSQVAADTLLDKFGVGAKIFVIGAQGLRDEVTSRGMMIVEDPMLELDAVVQGMTFDLKWQDLANGAIAVERGAYYLATNLDSTFPVANGLAPGNGMMVKAIVEASGVEPDSVGKPEPAMLTRAMDRLGSKKPLVIGDRLDTDVEAANKAGLDSLLVFTGVTKASDLENVPEIHKPRFVAEDLRGLLSSIA